MKQIVARVLILVFAGFGPLAARTDANISTDQARMLSLVNRERQSAGLPALSWDPHLAQSARAHALLLVQHQALSHRFEGEPDLSERVGSTGLRFDAAGENVAVAPSVASAHQGLMNSPPHRANILDRGYNAVGISILPWDGDLYVAQNFAHVLPVYSEGQFQNQVLATVNKLRQSKELEPLAARSDTHLREIACAEDSDVGRIIRTLPGVTDLVIFTSSEPEKLPPNMKETATGRRPQRMNIGVCFRPGHAHGYGSFWVVAAFYSR